MLAGIRLARKRKFASIQTTWRAGRARELLLVIVMLGLEASIELSS